MPYVEREARERMKAGGMPKTVGDLNYLISLELKRQYVNNPKYSQIHTMFEDFFERPETNVFLNAFSRGLPFGRTEINSASRLAMLEFYRRIGANHEDIAIAKNGDIYGDILSPIPAARIK